MIVLKSYATWATLVIIGLLFAAYRTIDHDIIVETMRVGAVTFMAMMVPAYAPSAASCYSTPGWPRREQWAGLATFILCLFAAVSGLVSLFYRLAGRPGWLLELPIINAWSLGLIVFGAAYTTAPGFFGPETKRRTKIALSILWAASTALIIYLALARPDLAPAAAWIDRTFIKAPAT